MDRESARERRRIATEAAMAALGERRRQTERDAAEPPRLGDVYLFRRTAELPVEWVVAERRAEDGRLFVVPLDDFPFAGSRDVELSAPAARGAAIVRCDSGVWLEEAAFEAELSAGVLTAEDVERIGEKRAAIVEGRLAPTFLESEIDSDPEYRRWCDETLRPALDALCRKSRPAPTRPAPTLPAQRRSVLGGVRRWAVPLAVAAGAVFAVRLVTDQEVRQLREALEAERDRVAESQAEVTELTAALKVEPEVNLPVFRLGSGQRRGDAVPIVLPPEARRVVMALEVADPEYYPRYRLRILEAASSEVVWQTAELVRQGSLLHLALPAVFFETGQRYELRLSGLKDGREVELEDAYLIEVGRSGRAGP